MSKNVILLKYFTKGQFCLIVVFRFRLTTLDEYL